MALWDLTAALDWVHENIQLFGGDPDRITVAGHSAGAVLASMLDVSPISTGNLLNRFYDIGHKYVHSLRSSERKKVGIKLSHSDNLSHQTILPNR